MSAAIGNTSCSACRRHVPTDEPAFVHEDAILCRECHDAARPLCPSCGAIMNRTLPKAHGKCPACGQLFYVRTDQWAFPTTILNAEQKQLVYEVSYETTRCEQAGVPGSEIRQMVRKAMGTSTDIHSLLDMLRRRAAVAVLGETGLSLARRDQAAPLAAIEAEDRLHRVLHMQWIDRAAITQACADLTEQFGASPSAGDVVWSCLNQALLRVPDDRARAQVYSAMARACQCEGRASNHLIKESFRCEARAWKSSQSVLAVEVLWGTGGCKGAARIVEKTYPIDQFIEDPPVPAPDCTQDVLKRGDNPCCNCGIAPVLEPLEGE